VTVVLKVGGASTAGAAGAVQELRADGHAVCVVHGAGPQISDEMARRGLGVRFVGGRRVTTPEALAVVRESFRLVNESLCAAIGPDAVGLAGDEIGLEAVRVPELGLVGDPMPSRPGAVVAGFFGCYGVLRFVNEFYRGYTVPLGFLGLTAGQGIGVGLVATSLGLLAWRSACIRRS